MMFKKLRTLSLLLALTGLAYTAQAQNVGVGTNQPNARLHVNGVIKTDSAIVVKPSTKAAANSISIGKNDGFVTISNTASAQTNAITMSGTPRPGQWLGISNQDDNDATFASTTIAAGTVGFFIYDGAAWKSLQNGGGSSTPLDSLTDADGDTKILVEATPDEDLIKLVVPDGIYPETWVFSHNNFAPPAGSLVNIGQGAGKNLSGDEHATILIGASAGYNLTDEVVSTVAIGTSALYNGGEMEHSTAIGSSSLFNATGGYNTALGSNAGRGASNFSGKNNTFIGALAGYGAVGSNNVFLGSGAGRNATGSGNVFLGSTSGYNETGSNKLYIENSNSSSPLIYGEFDSNLVRINGLLDINNAYHFPLADGTSGQVLSTNGSGQVSWTTAFGGKLDSLTDADGDTKVLVEATPDEDLIKLVVPNGIGLQTWVFSHNNLASPSSDIISIGKDAGKNLNGDEFGTVLLGGHAGYNLTDAVGSTTAIGSSALYKAGEIDHSTAIGASSLLNATGNYNTALGSNAGRGASNFSGTGNTFIGALSGLSAQGANNVFLGREAGKNATGSGNVFLGRSSGFNETGSNKLYIENSNSSSPLIYGEFDSNLVRINGLLDINNAYHFPLADGTSGQVLSTNGSGQVSWTTVSVSSGNTLIDADSDTKIQVEESADEDMIRFDLGGTEKWLMTGNRIEPASNNTLIGKNAGTALTSGSNVTAFGANALQSNTSAYYNSAFGFNALQAATSGQWNSAFGYNAGKSVTTGERNVFVGESAGLNTTTGGGNTFIGSNAGGNNTTGYGNVFIGSNAGGTDTGLVQRLYIANTNTNSPLIYGEFNSGLLRINGTLDINNAYQLPTADGNSGQVLGTDGSGNVAWTSLTTSSIADADDDTKIQVEESADEDKIRFDLGGNEKWLMTGNRLEPAADNTLIGQNAGTAITSGSGNTAYGANALKANTTADNNAAFGSSALQSVTTGQFNGGYGTNAGYNLTDGDRNVFVGNSAGYSNVSGSNNTFVGQFAGYSNKGSDNVFLGRYAGGSDTTSNKLYIANSNTSSPLIYGEFDNNLLEINGNLRPGSDNSRSLGASGKRWTAVYATNGTIQTSDARFKDSIENMSYGLTELMQLRSVTYQWKEDSLGETKLGFIAQELEQVVPEVVTVANDSMQTRGVNYAELIPVLVKAIQEQQKQIEDYKLQIEDSKLEIKNAEAANAAQDQRLAELEAKLQLLLNAAAATASK